MGLIIKVYNHRKISEPAEFQVEDFMNYREMMTYLGYFNLIKKLDIVLAPFSELPLFIGNCEFANIDFIFNYLLGRTSQSISLSESIFAGGKGFTYYKAICSSLGEAFERFMACLEYFVQEKNIVVASYDELCKQNRYAANPAEYSLFSEKQYEQSNFLFDKFDNNSVVGWIPMKEYRTEKEILFPACLVLMYYVQQEKNEARIGYSTSGGLTSQYEPERGILHGIEEIIERHEINLSWYCKIPPKEIILDKVENPRLLKFEEYIKDKNIHFYRHNVDQENFHVVTAMSFDHDMTKYSFNAGGGVANDIESAIVGALEEYMQSVNNTRKIVYAPNWITSSFSNQVLEVHEGDDPKNFKTFYQAVSFYGLACYKDRLNWFVKGNKRIKLAKLRKEQRNYSIAEYVIQNSIEPVCSVLNMQSCFRRIYISKVYMKEFSSAFIAGIPALGHKCYSKYLKEGEIINEDILPFP